ncbi:MFS transporter [Aminipila butyrica]|uniref:MFS transporter n=1 Tax=Aminipila butyrica TaxID=433296 RepID=A0A858BVP7_9FIRM|nr:MFS transporter [Aminipila butyrica]QIB68980.1 MFS transporter [Aminipila butyrica]
MDYKQKNVNRRIAWLKGARMAAAPLALLMFFSVQQAWGVLPAILLGVGFGVGFLAILNASVADCIGGELKNGVENMIRRATGIPVHIECGKAWGRMSFLIFLQEDNEAVTKAVYRKVVEKLKNSDYFNQIEVISMANVPDLEKETIKRFKNMMMRNAVEMVRSKKRSK